MRIVQFMDTMSWGVIMAHDMGYAYLEEKGLTMSIHMNKHCNEKRVDNVRMHEYAMQ